MDLVLLAFMMRIFRRVMMTGFKNDKYGNGGKLLGCMKVGRKTDEELEILDRTMKKHECRNCTATVDLAFLIFLALVLAILVLISTCFLCRPSMLVLVVDL